MNHHNSFWIWIIFIWYQFFKTMSTFTNSYASKHLLDGLEDRLCGLNSSLYHDMGYSGLFNRGYGFNSFSSGLYANSYNGIFNRDFGSGTYNRYAPSLYGYRNYGINRFGGWSNSNRNSNTESKGRFMASKNLIHDNVKRMQCNFCFFWGVSLRFLVLIKSQKRNFHR